MAFKKGPGQLTITIRKIQNTTNDWGERWEFTKTEQTHIKIINILLYMSWVGPGHWKWFLFPFFFFLHESR
jgi:hypothetical protein